MVVLLWRGKFSTLIENVDISPFLSFSDSLLVEQSVLQF